MPPGRTRSAAERSSASCSSGSGFARQRRSGRCDMTPRPEHGASTSARSKPSRLGGQLRPVGLDDGDVRRPEQLDVGAQLARAVRVELDGRHVAAQLRRLAAGRGADVEHAFAVLRADDEAGELRGAALRPDRARRRPRGRRRARRDTRPGCRSPRRRPAGRRARRGSTVSSGSFPARISASASSWPRSRTHVVEDPVRDTTPSAGRREARRAASACPR